MSIPLIFEQSHPGRKAYSLPQSDVGNKTIDTLIPEKLLRDKLAELPEISELDLVRHYTRLSRRNFGVDLGFYPLGSCTMKYNPKLNEDIAALSGFQDLHPYQDVDTVQGVLQILYETGKYLAEISGMDAVTLQPAAGAQGELTGMLMIRAYHEARGEKRTKVIVPDSAHGTNPATAVMCGYDIVEVKSNGRGCVDVEELKRVVDNQVAALMLTNPNTLGLFEEEIQQIAEIVHNAGGLLYYDGANANAILGITRPGDMGFDVVHFNLHKTFSTPHGGGGPGSGPVGVKQELASFLPVPLIGFNGEKYYFDYDVPDSIGKIKSFYGNFGIIVRAYAYIRQLGPEGLRQVSEAAVLNANYLLRKLKPYYAVPFDRPCKHEFIISPKEQKKSGVHTLDIAKRLLDYGYHPPTIYFPLVVDEAMMIEPTETESKETLDAFVDALKKINTEIESDPEKIKYAPHTTVIGRLDEVAAARKPELRWKINEN